MIACDILRFIGSNRVCVRLEKNGVVICLELQEEDQMLVCFLKGVSAFRPQGALVNIGDYMPEKFCFQCKKINIAESVNESVVKTTKYKKIRL